MRRFGYWLSPKPSHLQAMTIALKHPSLTIAGNIASLASPINSGGSVNRWTLQDAKNRLSAVVREARAHGPQRITLHGVDAVVVLAMEDYERLTGGTMNIIDALRRSPLAAALASGELIIDRDPDSGRDIPL